MDLIKFMKKINDDKKMQEKINIVTGIMKKYKIKNNDSKDSEDIKIDTFRDIQKNNEYPTKEEYEAIVKRIQKEEIESERFKEICNFLIKYYRRENLELERTLFKIVGSYGIEDNLINKSYDVKKISRIKRFDDLKNFMNSLTMEQVESNIYFKIVEKLMEISIEDCQVIVSNLRKKIDKINVSDESQRLEVKGDISSKVRDLLPNDVQEQVGIPYYKPYVYKISYIYLLDEENRGVYKEYNQYVRNVKKLLHDIYFLQIWNLLSIYPEKINHYHFTIINNKFESNYFVNKYRQTCINDVDNSINLLYELSDEVRNDISRIVGLPFDEIVTVIELYKKKKDSIYGMKVNQDIDSVNSDNQVIEEESIKFTGPKRVLKKGI